MESLETLKKRQRLGNLDEHTVSLVKRARETQGDLIAQSFTPGAVAVQAADEDLHASDSGSDSGSDEDPLDGIAMDWRAKR
jgi:hypothetical protein